MRATALVVAVTFLLPLVRAGSAGAEEHTNEIKGLAFNPEQITIRAGDSITWVNHDSDRHRLSGDGIESGELPNRGRFTAQFPEPAQLAYHCTITPTWRVGSSC